MLNLFRFVGLRHLRMKPARAILTTLGVAFGVALYAAISIINRSTLDSFTQSIEAVAGKATLTVTAGDAGFAEEKTDVIKSVPGVKHAVPMVETRAYFAGTGGDVQTLVVLGVDLLKEQAVRTYKTADEQVIDDPLVFLNQPDSIIITHAFAKQHRFALDSKFELATADGKRPFTVRGLLSPEGPGKAYGGAMAIMDILGAQASFGKEGRVDRVDVVTAPGADVEKVAEAIRAKLGPGHQAERPESQSEGMTRMVESFQGMLAFFSTLALLVGLFLVANSVSIAVAERRREIGTLRALGATRRSIMILFLSEATVMGAVGSLIGVGLGRVLASFMVGLVSEAMSNQYLTRIEVAKLVFTHEQILRAVGIGSFAAMVAAFIPALRSTSVQPLDAMKRVEAGAAVEARGITGKMHWIGLAMLAFMASSTLLGWRQLHWLVDLLAEVSSVFGSALVAPMTVGILIRLFRPVLLPLGGPITRLAQDNLLRNPVRTGSNVMSLIVGLMLVIMIAIVSTSFRTSIIQWFDRVLRADLLISSNGRLISYQTQPIHESLGAELMKVPGVRARPSGEAYGLRFVHVDYQGKQLGVKAYDEPDPEIDYAVIDVVEGGTSRDAGMKLYHSEKPVALVSQNFVLHFGKKIGDSIELDTPSGRVSFEIGAVITDFASNIGVLYLDRKVYRRFWKDPLVNAFGVQVTPGVPVAQVRAEIDRRFGKARNLVTISNTEMRASMLETVDDSFAYTRAIEWAALLVGLLGLLNTLLVSVMERTRELGMLRAVGMSRGQMARMILGEALTQGGYGALVAVALGSWIAYLFITNTLAHQLGWMVGFHFPWTGIGVTVLTGIAVALLAGLFPARRAANIEIREALEYE